MSRAALIAAFVSGIVGLGGLASWWLSRPSAEEFAQQAQVALDSGQPEQALKLAQEALERAPGLVRANLVAGAAAARLGRREEALANYKRGAANGASRDAVVALGAAAELLVKLGRLGEAEQMYRRLLEQNPDDILANRRLAAIYVLEGRRRESEPHLFHLLKSGEAQIDELGLLGNLEQIYDNLEAVEHFRRLAPDDPLPLLGAARIEIRRNQTHEAERLLRQVVTAAPDLLEARVQLGRVLVELGDADEFFRWHRELPAEADDNADIWAVRGLWAQKQRQHRPAIRCYWEAVRRDPNHWKASYQLAQVLLAEGESERAQSFLNRAEKLNRIVECIRWILLEPQKVHRMHEAARLTEALGRPWEAWGWYATISRLLPGDFRAREGRDRLREQLTAKAPRTLPSANPAARIDLSSYSLPDWLYDETPVGRGAQMQLSGDLPPAKVRFADRATSAGVDFRFHSGDDSETEGMWMWESFGGGVAVLDFDLDAWPDLYFTQGGDWSSEERGWTANPSHGSDPHRDRLFRNTGARGFEDVTVPAGLDETSYSQGVAAGDFNGDGFPDLYVANIGVNRLYRNNGDGTSCDVTETSGIVGAVWTSSCVMADLNADGHPDIYDVNYLAGDAPFTTPCRDDETQLPRACPPTRFAAEPDRLYVSQGDGTFVDATSAAGVLAADGKGLGVVAADLDGSGRLSLYVANDTTPNFLFINETPDAPARGAGDLSHRLPIFSEQAVIRGCALDVEGRAQAGMGIACADANADGLWDLFVTNFDNEYNTLYTQQPGGLFRDSSAETGLKQPSVRKLGFGTQFLDADLDGSPDLVVGNGHVDDFRFKGSEFRMRPQFFSNRGGGRFAELPGESVGDYFQKTWLGRGLARVDWNRDGREDFAVSHLHAPVALVTNETPEAGHFLALRFQGVKSSRDGIGTVVRVSAGGRTRVGQLLAGDGYYASNQRQLIFGLGGEDRAEELTIRWPSGAEQTFRNVRADQELLALEDHERLWPLPR